MLLTFTVLYVMGITLNMVVLFSLNLVLGMLVDNAIVIVENIHRFMEQGAGRVEAAMRATSEVAYPVIGSTLTTLAAFAPMLYWPGVMGKFMRYLPFTLIVTLTASLFVALVINPALAALFMQEKPAAAVDRKVLDTTLSVEEPVAQFNSINQPFLIMTLVILSLGGAFLGLMLHRQPFGIIMTVVGVISLAGVVVNNAIVLIDYINKLIARGYPLKEAVIGAGATRLRPVLLTAITTILGLVPMITSVSFDSHNFSIAWVSESSQWWRSMAVVVAWGLSIATFLTLAVVPAMYYLLARSKERASELRAWLHSVYWRLCLRLFEGDSDRR